MVFSIPSAFMDRYAVVQQFSEGINTYWANERSAMLEEGMNNDMHCIITQTLQQYQRMSCCGIYLFVYNRFAITEIRNVYAYHYI